LNDNDDDYDSDGDDLDDDDDDDDKDSDDDDLDDDDNGNIDDDEACVSIIDTIALMNPTFNPHPYIHLFSYVSQDSIINIHNHLSTLIHHLYLIIIIIIIRGISQ